AGLPDTDRPHRGSGRGRRRRPRSAEMADTTTTTPVSSRTIPAGSTGHDHGVTTAQPGAAGGSGDGVTVVHESVEDEVHRLVTAALTRHPPRHRPFYEGSKRALDLAVALPL